MADETKTIDPSKPGESNAADLIAWAADASPEDRAAALAAERADKGRATVLLALENGDPAPAPAEPEAPKKRERVSLDGFSDGNPAPHDLFLSYEEDGTRHLSKTLEPGTRAQQVAIKGVEVDGVHGAMLKAHADAR